MKGRYTKMLRIAVFIIFFSMISHLFAHGTKPFNSEWTV